MDPVTSAWIDVGPLDSFADGKLRAVTVRPDGGGALSVLVVRIGDELAAYLNACAHQGLRMDGAALDLAEGTVRCPWHGYCYDVRSGECLSVPGAALLAVPVRAIDGQVEVQVEVEAKATEPA